MSTTDPLPNKITFSRHGKPVSFDRDLAEKWAPAETRAVVEANAKAPQISLDIFIALGVAQFARDEAAKPLEDQWCHRAKLETQRTSEFINHVLETQDEHDY